MPRSSHLLLVTRQAERNWELPCTFSKLQACDTSGRYTALDIDNIDTTVLMVILCRRCRISIGVVGVRCQVSAMLARHKRTYSLPNTAIFLLSPRRLETFRRKIPDRFYVISMEFLSHPQWRGANRLQDSPYFCVKYIEKKLTVLQSKERRKAVVFAGAMSEGLF